MRYVAAYLLAGLGGNEKPSVRDIEAILSSVGIETNKERLMQLFNALEGKNIEEIIAAGKEKLATVGAAATHAEGVTAESGTAGTPDIEEVKEEKKEDTEESDDDLGFGLFD